MFLNKYMPRPATHHELTRHHNLLLLCILALFVVLGIVVFKYILVKQVWRENAVGLQGGIQKYQTAESIEAAQVIGTTIVTFPPIVPFLKNQPLLQQYVSKVGEQTGRDIVILNKNKKIIAATLPANVGQTYSFDLDGKIEQTMLDGNPRSFNEKSSDYPNGITLEIVQLKDQKGTIVGAILISPSNIFQ